MIIKTFSISIRHKKYSIIQYPQKVFTKPLMPDYTRVLNNYQLIPIFFFMYNGHSIYFEVHMHAYTHVVCEDFFMK